MHSWTDTLRFAFQPVVNLATGGVAGLEILARPETGDILAEARRNPELDGRLAVLAVRAAARKETLLPLHVNVFAGTLADLGGLTPLHTAVREAGRLPWEVTIDIGPPYTHVPQRALLEAVSALRARGIRFLSVPPSYYDDVQRRLGHLRLPWAELASLGILIDEDDDGYLLQTFTENVGDRPTVFIEIIHLARRPSRHDPQARPPAAARSNGRSGSSFSL